ncbi:aminopeptidase NAALADL1 [Carcharodon carcharias]|uniref:aminopeptidase NAALADL1 n=1 Tax=Carcharodon carcharias TaxID=13397 RepID=UPI001B7E5C06|nr:aminopeptidase NAALADL1 [Carcharodon carcharias]
MELGYASMKRGRGVTSEERRWPYKNSRTRGHGLRLKWVKSKYMSDLKHAFPCDECIILQRNSVDRGLRMKSWLVALISGIAALVTGLLIGHFAIPKDGITEQGQGSTQDIDESLIQRFMGEVDNKRIEDNLRELSKKPHMATTKGDIDLVNLMLDRWQNKETGLDEAKKVTYDVLLDFPDKNNPNRVTVVAPNGTVLFKSRIKEVNYTKDQLDPDVVQPFAAFTPAGECKGRLVYANYGTMDDYQHLNKTIDLNNTIAIVRYGGTGRGDKGINGARFGVSGVIVYTDPADINDGKLSDKNETYPHSWYLPPSGVERGSYKSNFGDQLTPYYPAKGYTFRQAVSNITGLSPIPAQPIGFEDAHQLICGLTGDEAPEAWQGGLGCTYRLGPGFHNESSFADSDVTVSVHNKMEIKPSDNVIGIIRGSVEPDRYVIYGNHRDSWVHGAIDPSSGTAVMLEISRVLGKMVKEDQDTVMTNTLFLITPCSPWFHKILQPANYQSDKYSPGAITTSVTVPGHQDLSVYENWKKHSNRTSPLHGVIPNMGSLGAGSDYAPFFHYLGISSMDISYTYDKTKTKARIYPAYHTAYDTFDYASRFIDPGFTSHQTVGRTAGNVLLRLADSAILPFNIRDYSEAIEQLYQAAKELFNTELSNHNISLAPLHSAVTKLKEAADGLHLRISEMQDLSTSPLKQRMINDQLMLLERSFLDPMAFPDKLYYRHIIYASQDSAVETFPGLADAYQHATVEGGSWDDVRKHLTIITHTLESAASTLEAVI